MIPRPNQTAATAKLPNPARRIPRATYRLQFNSDFTFAQALDLAVYLSELGISDCYASPLFRAAPQSTHGYDVCGWDELDPRLGGIAGFNAWAARLKELGLGLLLDIVPNHMGTGRSNRWWWDVLEAGPASRYAQWFDINWRPAGLPWQDQVLLPVLEEHYAKVLEAGKLRIVVEETGLAVAYHDHRFPVAADSYRVILQRLLEQPLDGRAFASSAFRERLHCFVAGKESPRPDDFAQFKTELLNHYKNKAEFRERVDAELRQLNGVAGQPASLGLLDAILRQQHFRLAFWRNAAEALNYRRFFDVTGLVSLRVELMEVFEASHKLVLDLVREGKVTGLRIDHPDGLWNPRQYLDRVRAAADAVYLVVEKILTGNEPLPEDWPVEGTTGYDFLYHVNNLFVKSDNRAAYDEIYGRFAAGDEDFIAVACRSKLQVLRQSFGSELKDLTNRLEGIAASSRNGFDLTFQQLKAALEQVIVGLPIYRTYVAESTTELSANEGQALRVAVQRARQSSPGTAAAALDFIEDLLRLGSGAADTQTEWRVAREYILRLQQLTGPAMAKGLEDTAFYRYHRLVSLNEVGGEPHTFGISLDDFHRYNSSKALHWPHSLLATATHDTKRGEDLRARLNVLSEIPDEWAQAVSRWSRLNADKKTIVHGRPAPAPNDEYLLYQTLVGAWPAEIDSPRALETFRARIVTYFLKALKEAKTFTSWTDPNPEYEAAATRFVELLLGSADNPFLNDFGPFQRRVAYFGMFNSLSQLLLKLASPGVPDFYQGTELWDLNLVDPDNRRAVDYTRLRRSLTELKGQLAAETNQPNALLKRLLAEAASGQIKLFVTWRVLDHRRQHPALFEQGEYVPLIASGAHREHVCAFARVRGEEALVVVAPRFPVALTGGVERAPLGQAIWRDSVLSMPQTLRHRTFKNVLTSETVSLNERAELGLANVLSSFPVALLYTAS